MTKAKRSIKQASDHKGQMGARHFSSEEFEADTQEDRSVPVLAEKRRQFLSRLEAKGSGIPTEE